MPAGWFAHLAELRSPERSSRHMWRVWVIGIVTVHVAGLAILLHVFRPDVSEVADVIGGLLPVVAIALLSAPIATSIDLGSGLRAISIDMLDVLIATILILAPILVLAGPSIWTSDARWLALPATAVAVFLVAGFGGTAILFTRTARGHRLPATIGLGMIGLGAIDASLLVVQALAGFTVFAPPLIAVQCAALGLVMLLPVHSPLQAPKSIDELAVEQQVRRRQWTPAILVVGCAALIAEAVWLHDERPWIAFVVIGVLVAELALATVRQTLTTNEAVRLAGELSRHAEEQRTQALTDPLTGLANRRALFSALPAAASNASRSGTPVTVAMLDLDHFKGYNDRHGHVAGDALLAQVGSLLRSSVRAHDIVARYGGEEFCVVLWDADEAESVRVLDGIRARCGAAGTDGPACTFSAGVAQWWGEERLEATLARADDALYGAKEAGRDRVVPASAAGPCARRELDG
jgi:diguanylate cyclase (GGDEF)-like protein